LRQLAGDAVECRQPFAQQVRVVAGAEEALGAVEQAGVVFAPFHAVAGPEVVSGAIERVEGRLDDVVGAGQVDRAVGIGQTQRLLGVERVAALVGYVSHVATGGLVAEPFAHVALVGAGARGEFGRRGRGLGQRLVQPEAVADQHQSGADRSAQVANSLAEEGIEFVLVDVHRWTPRD